MESITSPLLYIYIFTVLVIEVLHELRNWSPIFIINISLSTIRAIRAKRYSIERFNSVSYVLMIVNVKIKVTGFIPCLKFAEYCLQYFLFRNYSNQIILHSIILLCKLCSYSIWKSSIIIEMLHRNTSIPRQVNSITYCQCLDSYVYVYCLINKI